MSLFPRHGCGIIDDLTEEFNGENSQAIGVTAGRNTPLPTGVFLDEFNEDEPDGVWPFRELVGSLMWHTYQARPDISNAARTVARFAHAPKQKTLEGCARDFGELDGLEQHRRYVSDG